MHVGAKAFNFEQCRTGLAAQKSTQLLCTPDLLAAAQAEFGHLRCRDSVCVETGERHVSFLGDTSGLERYTSDMCWKLARVFNARKVGPPPDAPPRRCCSRVTSTMPSLSALPAPPVSRQMQLLVWV